MKTAIALLAFGLMLSTAAAALAKTATGTIPVTAQIVSGNSVTAFLTGGEIVTTVNHDGPRTTPGAMPIVRVDFPTERTWFLVKRVTWDKIHRHLTIDF